VELGVTMAMVGVMAAMAAPSIADTVQVYRRSQQLSLMRIEVQNARADALEQRQPQIVKVTSGTTVLVGLANASCTDVDISTPPRQLEMPNLDLAALQPLCFDKEGHLGQGQCSTDADCAGIGPFCESGICAAPAAIDVQLVASGSSSSRLSVAPAGTMRFSGATSLTSLQEGASAVSIKTVDLAKASSLSTSVAAQ
jgi:type II secretory pathway pseudopilin PulG